MKTRAWVVLVLASFAGACTQVSRVEPRSDESVFNQAEAHAAVLAWFDSHAIEHQPSAFSWGSPTPESSGANRLRASIGRGQDETGSERIDNYYFEFQRGSITAVWGPRAVGSGCTCHYPDVSRIE